MTFFSFDVYNPALINDSPHRSVRSQDEDNSSDESESNTPRKRPAEAMDFKIKYKTEVN